MTGGGRLRVRRLGLRDYAETWAEMARFTEARASDTPDEVWLVEHPPVFTLGRNGDPAHLLGKQEGGNLLVGLPCGGPAAFRSVPLVKSDRGGQVTYHGPGQLVAYTLFDLNRLDIGVRSLVVGLENAVIASLAQYGIGAAARRDAPGVYVDSKKIASLGLRVRKACSYHGLSLNVDMDLSPFRAINPCGYEGLEVTQLADQGAAVRTCEVAVPLLGELMRQFHYDELAYSAG